MLVTISRSNRPIASIEPHGRSSYRVWMEDRLQEAAMGPIADALAAVILRVPLTASFWNGAFMVCGGSILCWLATRGRSAKPV